MDDAPLRRGAPTAHVVFGEAVAILAGDALLTLGLSVLSRFPAGERYSAAKLAILAIATDAVGSGGMIGGQVADLEAERGEAATSGDAGGGPGGPPTPLASAERLLAIHEAKTGRLFRAALAAGGLLAFASEEVLSRLDAYGRALGVAFQIKDDLLDVEADAATLGKRPGSDLAARKLTFPAVWGLEKSRAELEEKIREAEAHARSLPGGGERLADLARFVGTRQA